jgi:hypothetical protein
MEARYSPWTVRLEAIGQFPDVIYLTQWLREQAGGMERLTLTEMVGRLATQWPERRYRVEQDQKIGRLLVET